MQIPLFKPQTEWTPPTEFPNLSKYNEIAIDLETKDPDLVKMGSGSVTKRGDVVGIAVAVKGWKGYFPIAHEGGGNMDRANAEAEAEANKARDEYNQVSGQINKDIASREAKAAATKASQDKEIAAWKTKASTAQASATRSAKEGAAKVAYAKKQRGATESKIQQQKLAKKAAELAAAKQATKPKAAGQPGIATTTVKAIGGLGGTGKTGSAKAKTKGTKDKPGRLVIG